jgi:hypothetical protein
MGATRADKAPECADEASENAVVATSGTSVSAGKIVVATKTTATRPEVVGVALVAVFVASVVARAAPTR